MKILILQLARLGDIYQTWPVLRALKRTYPQAEIHFLTRSKFAPAAPALGLIDRHWTFDTRDFLSPLIDEKPDIDATLKKLSRAIDDLRSQGFNKIINLSFSPFSSFLTAEIAGTFLSGGNHAGFASPLVALPKQVCEVKGYTRFVDGYLRIPDDGSAYFYAQAGVGRPNRVHVTDLFGFVADVQLEINDWKFETPLALPPGSQALSEAGPQPIVIHIGASEPGKTLSWSKWLQVTKGMIEAQNQNVVLVGSPNEREMAEKICASSLSRTPVNMVGRTTLPELFEIIRGAALLIGGDSAPVHIASLTNTPVLNISFPMVSFFETGPRSNRSRIFPIDAEEKIAAEEIVAEAIAQLANRSTPRAVLRVVGQTYPYIELRPQPGGFEWLMLKAIYMSADFPPAPHDLFMLGLRRLGDVVDLAREQLVILGKNPSNSTASDILDRAVDITYHIEGMVPELAPLVRWFKTELLRLGPMTIGELVEATDSIYVRLGEVVDLYLPREEQSGEVSASAEQLEASEGDGYDDVSVG